MQRVHFIAIGGDAMHNMAIAISKKPTFLVTGSDSEFNDPTRIKLDVNGLLPGQNGWFPERINKGLTAIILGMNVTEDNPELKRARELKLNIYSFPDFLFQQTRSKTRIVVAGGQGKSTIVAMILFVLRKLKVETDYLISKPFEGFENIVKLTYDSRIAVFEGDEKATSSIDSRPQFHLYKPHIALITGIDTARKNEVSTNENQVEVFRKFTEIMEVQGRLIYFDGDNTLTEISSKLRRDIVTFPYNTHEHKIKDGVTYLKTKKEDIPLKISGDLNLQNINAARLACRQLGIYEEQFYSIISEFQEIQS